MTATFPTSPRADFLAWCNSHQSIFTANAAAVGLSSSQASDFKSRTEEATAAQAALEDAKVAYESAAGVARDAVAALRSSATDTVRIIRTFAVTTNDPSVYNIAGIPAPKVPGTLPPPGQPYELGVSLTANGAPEITWKCDNPVGASGTAYIIMRRLSNQQPWSFVGVSGTRRFTDNLFIAGPDRVEYQVQAQRADRAGAPSFPLVVSFGVVGTGPTMQSSAIIGQIAKAA